MPLNPQEEANKILSPLWKENLFPVDPRISQRLGLQVVGTELPENVSGALIKDEKKANSKLDRGSKNKYAHCLCRYC